MEYFFKFQIVQSMQEGEKDAEYVHISSYEEAEKLFSLVQEYVMEFCNRSDELYQKQIKILSANLDMLRSQCLQLLENPDNQRVEKENGIERRISAIASEFYDRAKVRVTSRKYTQEYLCELLDDIKILQKLADIAYDNPGNQYIDKRIVQIILKIL